MGILTLEDFIERFTEIKAMGWIKTHRSGQTGIGKTLEDLERLKSVLINARKRK